MHSIIKYFTDRPLLTNVILFGVIAAGMLSWALIGKEEFPDFAMDWVRVRVPYPGAAAEDVELFVTRPIEEKLKGLSGIDQVVATSSSGSSSFRVSLAGKGRVADETIDEIKDAIDRTPLPAEVDDPVYSRFSSATKAIIDIGVYHTGAPLLTTETRAELQRYALAFENRIIALPEVSGVDKQGYLKPELQIMLDPARLRRYDISLGEVRQQILSQHIRMPAGSMDDRQESEVTFVSELDNVDALERTIVRGGFEGQKIRLGQLAQVRDGFARNRTIFKVQGHEAILFNIQKSAKHDILSSQEAVMKFVEDFRNTYADAPIGVVTIDDESFDIRNRLSIITYNGLAGFALILLVLFIFLDFKSGIWVAMGLPFTLAFTLLAVLIIGATINNMTLAAVIIVLGIVVDDAIIVAENISRLHREGRPLAEAAVDGTAQMIRPILASILTTCAAFVPLLFFSGRFGFFVRFIPVIVCIMLAASLLESMLVLPGHLSHPTRQAKANGHWFFRVERVYARVLRGMLRFRLLILVAFAGLLVVAGYVAREKMRFVMFPREETRELSIRAVAPPDTTREEMAKLIEPLERVFLDDDLNVVMSVITRIGQSRRGGAVKENEASLRVELKPRGERAVPIRSLLARWEPQAKKLETFTEVRFMKSRWGHDSGSAIEIEIQENSDTRRLQIVEALKAELEANPALNNVEVERPVLRNEYRLTLKQEEVFLLGISPREVASTLRSFIEGQILYRINKGDEEVDVRLTGASSKQSIQEVLSLRAANRQSLLVPYRSVVTLDQIQSPANIQRVNYKRATRIYADLKDGGKRTPLEIATSLEANVFPRIARDYPTSILTFRGEIEDSRRSQSDFRIAVTVALLIIYLLLVLLYNSLTLPVVIGTIIPFGAVGVVFAFMGHGMNQYGFFAVVGTLGMIGVVINDAIVMVSRLEQNKGPWADRKTLFEHVASISSTRLRAVIVTTITTVVALFPTAYGWAGYDSMLAEMMLALGWGLIFGTLITLVLVPCLYSYYTQARSWVTARFAQ